jgi:3-oxoacyl-[acyl-carrier protein] reductase
MPDTGSRVALITGGARGIGRAVAERLLGDGIAVVLCDVRDGAAEEAAGELGPRAIGLTADVTDEAAVQSLFAAIGQRHERLDIVVNSAGIAPRRQGAESDVDRMTLAQWSQVLAVNLTGPFLICRAAIPLMKRRRFGRVVNIASRAARTYSPAIGAHYSAAKSGLIGFSRVLAGEAGPFGITVNCIAPARVATPMTQDTATAEEDNRRTIAATPVGRVGEPRDIAGAVAYLASDDAAFVNGAILDVTGGAFMP